jgi:hypothetical protein
MAASRATRLVSFCLLQGSNVNQPRRVEDLLLDLLALGVEGFDVDSLAGVLEEEDGSCHPLVSSLSVAVAITELDVALVVRLVEHQLSSSLSALGWPASVLKTEVTIRVIVTAAVRHTTS